LPPIHSFPTRRSSDLANPQSRQEPRFSLMPDRCDWGRQCRSLSGGFKLAKPQLQNQQGIAHVSPISVCHHFAWKQFIDEPPLKVDRKSTRLNSSHVSI